MATSSMPMPGAGDPQGSPAQAGSGPAPGVQAPAPPEMIMLAKISQVLQQLAQSNPVLSGGLQKALAGIQEAQTAMVTQPQPLPAGSTPPQ